jgi:formylglycine-generating enzyme required for sulfatase activity
MSGFDIYFPGIDYSFSMVLVKGTGDTTYSFGGDLKLSIRISDFFISRYLVTQRLWEHVMGNNPAAVKGSNKPVETVSYNDITHGSGFLGKMNELGEIKQSIPAGLSFRLPTESEWEYAARGGVHWTDGFHFSGSNDINAVGWYENNAGKITDPIVLRQLKNTEKGTETHEVGQKAPNQLGIFDMSGNVWEWCHDYFQADAHKMPLDGKPCQVESGERVLRGGCHHNWAIHCTVHKRYAIAPDSADGCIGFRLAASID